MATYLTKHSLGKCSKMLVYWNEGMRRWECEIEDISENKNMKKHEFVCEVESCWVRDERENAFAYLIHLYTTDWCKYESNYLFIRETVPKNSIYSQRNTRLQNKTKILPQTKIKTDLHNTIAVQSQVNQTLWFIFQSI